MAEYIEKAKIIDWFRPYGQTDEPILFETLVSDLRDMKAADVAPVIRCKECSHVFACNCLSCGRGFSVYCGKFGRHMTVRDFCSYGERKEG